MWLSRDTSATAFIVVDAVAAYCQAGAHEDPAGFFLWVDLSGSGCAFIVTVGAVLVLAAPPP